MSLATPILQTRPVTGTKVDFPKETGTVDAVKTAKNCLVKSRDDFWTDRYRYTRSSLERYEIIVKFCPLTDENSIFKLFFLF